VESDQSVAAAVRHVVRKYDRDKHPLHAICNNAGIGIGESIAATLNANFYSQKRVAEAFIPLLDRTSGRVCNIASAAGPVFVSRLEPRGRHLFTKAGAL
jgi:NAD(P)-dependent dehydrogenase (short-subunit alcohol dehydrogenase family)